MTYTSSNKRRDSDRNLDCDRKLHHQPDRNLRYLLTALIPSLLAILLSSSGQALAQSLAPESPASSITTEIDLPDSAAVHNLGVIIVTTDRITDQAPARTATLAEFDLATNPGQNARDLLKNVPGVGITTGRKDEAKITIRGFTSRRVAILVDGRPMNIPYYGDFNLASVNADKLSRVLVVRGPNSVSYGPNVMGGVVNFVTASGRDRPGTLLTARIGDNNSNEFSVTHGHLFNSGDLFLSLRRASSDGSPLSRDFVPTGYTGHEDGDYRDNSDFTEWDLFGKLGLKRNDNTDLALSWGYHTRDKGVPGAADEMRYWRFTDWRRYFTDLTLRHQLGSRTSLEAKVYGDIFINTLVDYEDETFNLDAVFYNSTHHNWDLGAIVSIERDWSQSHHATYGFNLREDQIKKRMNPSDPWLYHHQVTGSIFAEHQARLPGRWWGSCGLSDNIVVQNHLKDVDHVPGLSVGLSRKFAAGWRLYTSAGLSSRFPTLSQLWGTRSGNNELLPETTQRYELGLDGRFGVFVRTETTLFYNNLTDLIDRDARRTSRYYNIGDAESWGAELGGTVFWRDRFELKSTYTYTSSENSDTGKSLDLIPEHKIDTRIIIFSDDRRTQWVFILTCVSERFDSESLTEDQTISGYITADCKITTTLSDELTMSLAMQNIGDVQYEEEVMYPAPGRTYRLSGTVEF